MSTKRSILLTGSGAPLLLGRQLNSGGQGAVFDIVDDPSSVFKRYHEHELVKDSALEERLKLMMRLPPDGSRIDRSGHLLLTWPTDLVYDGTRFVGFLMPKLDTEHVAELHRVTDPSDRGEAIGPTVWLRGFNWRYLVSVAKNLALGTELLHASKVVVGDFNDRNVAVTHEARVTLFDCDSMQITDPVSETRFLCRVRRPEFLAPELHKTDLRIVVRPASSDLFALAVHLHQLLLEGEHPFRGKWNGAGDPPMEMALAKQGLWTHRGSSDIRPRPSAIGIDLLPEQLIEMFRTAFVDGALKPSTRPSAARWREALDDLDKSLKQCNADRDHWYPSSHAKCPWCVHAREHQSRRRQRQTGLPPPFTAPLTGATTAQPPPIAWSALRETVLGNPATAPEAAPVPTLAVPPQAIALNLSHALERARSRLRLTLLAILVGGFYAGSYTFSNQASQPHGLGEGLLWCGACALVASILAGLYDAAFGPARAQDSTRDVLLTGVFTAGGLALWALSFRGTNPSELGWLAPPLLMAIGHGIALSWVGSNTVDRRIRLVAGATSTVLALGCASTVLGVHTQQSWLSENPLAAIFEPLYKQFTTVVGVHPAGALTPTGALSSPELSRPVTTANKGRSAHHTVKSASTRHGHARAIPAQAPTASRSHISKPTPHSSVTHTRPRSATSHPSHTRTSSPPKQESHAPPTPPAKHTQSPAIEGHAEGAPPSGGGGGSSGIQGTPESSSGSSGGSGISGTAGQ